MAISSITQRGTGVSGASSTTLTQTPGGTVTAGAILTTMVVTRENVAVSSITDAVGNVWQFAGRYSNSTSGVAHVELWVCRVVNELAFGTVITATFAGAVVDKCMATREWSVAAGKTLIQTAEASAVGNEVNAANGFGSANYMSLTSKQRAYLRVLAKQANSTTNITPTASYTNWGITIRSRNNASAIIARGELRTLTATGETSNPTLAVSGDTAGMFFALEEADAAPAVISVSPDAGARNSTHAVTITGLAFRAGAAVTLWRGGVQVGTASSVNVSSDSTITCTFPSLSEGSVDVLVTNTDASTSGSTGNAKFTYYIRNPAAIPLGSRYKLGFTDRYVSGTWTADVSTDRMGQATVADRPTKTLTPGGFPVLTFDGVDNLDALNFSVNNRLNTLFAFPTASNYERMFGCVFKKTATVPSTFGTLWSAGNSSVTLNPFNQLVRWDHNTPSYVQTESTVTVNDGNWHTLIVVSKDATTGTVLYIDNSLQANTLARLFGEPTDWGASSVVTLGGGVSGSLGCLTFAHTEPSGTFSPSQVADVHNALLEWVQGAPASKNVVGSASFSLATSARLSAVKGLAASAGIAFGASASVSLAELTVAQVAGQAMIGVAALGAASRGPKLLKGSSNISFQTVAWLSGTVGTGYHPTVEGSVLHWREADSANMVLSGTSVVTWPNDSDDTNPSKNLTQSATGSRPTFNPNNSMLRGMPSVDFDGINDVLDSGLYTGSQPTTYYFVSVWGAHGANILMDDPPTALGSAHDLSNLTGRQLRAAAVNPGGHLPRAGEPFVLCAVFSGSVSRMYLGDPDTATGGGSNSSLNDSIRIGAGSGGSNFFSGSIAAVGAFSASHDQTARRRVFDYLYNKYIEENSPAKLYPSYWWRAPFLSSSFWFSSAPGRASFGAGDLDSAVALTPGTLINGKAPARFNGSTSWIDGPSASLLGTSSGSLGVYFQADSAAASGSYDAIPSILGTHNGILALGFSNAGVTFGYDSVVGDGQVSVPCATGSYHFAQAAWDGSNIRLRVDDGSWVSSSLGPIDPSFAFSFFRVGINSGNNRFFSGSILEIIAKDRSFETPEWDHLHSYMLSHYDQIREANASAGVSISAFGRPNKIAGARAEGMLRFGAEGKAAKLLALKGDALVCLDGAGRMNKLSAITGDTRFGLDARGKASRAAAMKATAGVGFETSGSLANVFIEEPSPSNPIFLRPRARGSSSQPIRDNGLQIEAILTSVNKQPPVHRVRGRQTLHETVGNLTVRAKLAERNVVTASVIVESSFLRVAGLQPKR